MYIYIYKKKMLNNDRSTTIVEEALKNNALYNSHIKYNILTFKTKIKFSRFNGKQL